MNKLYLVRLTIAGIVGILAILAVLGVFYPVHLLDLQYVAVLQRVIVNFSWGAIIILAGVIILTLLFGRFYCSTLCPLGILQEFVAFVRGKNKNKSQGNFGFKYLIAGLTFGALIGGSALLIRYIDPYTIFGSAVSLSVLGLVAFGIVAVLVFFKNRFFCTNICPVGAVLGLISKLSLNKIYIDDKCVSCGICLKNCPSGSIDFKNKTVDNETCVKCLKCLGECKKGAIKYGTQPVKFNPRRRDALWGIGALALLGVGYAAGLNFSKNLAKKIKDIILPAGAENTNRMANKCLNCNLCINNCPNKILAKADKNFPAVHIDYLKGEGYCKYDCHKCSEVCPSGAIKKISLQEKQDTRIGMAMVKEADCTKCGICKYECPKSAIDIENTAKVNGSLCIGCGKCAKKCPANAIAIFAVNKQGVIS